jgi:hypothetical protein
VLPKYPKRASWGGEQILRPVVLGIYRKDIAEQVLREIESAAARWRLTGVMKSTEVLRKERRTRNTLLVTALGWFALFFLLPYVVGWLIRLLGFDDQWTELISITGGASMIFALFAWLTTRGSEPRSVLIRNIVRWVILGDIILVATIFFAMILITVGMEL